MKFDDENVAAPGDPNIRSDVLASRSSSGSRSAPRVLTDASVEPVDAKMRFDLQASMRSEDSEDYPQDIASDLNAAGGKERGRRSMHKIQAGDRIRPEAQALLEWKDIEFFVPAKRNSASSAGSRTDDRTALLGVENGLPLPVFIQEGNNHYKQVL